ncbi:mechanosensitive ion channel family protein [Solimonas sp. SE-A11]|uniref:mechanosensitive ion channel family protein n=1 Tax=Solimonas sp. SE-A11 TaxID=3054954 RepID=UPI00259CAA1D|nr:mechanosensitive ion channel family protein [Solimonas sp. SE-A11]MDM4772999.1 mechanosensitive ion channel family protein [Solimonas sp. SE-A11]
MLLETSILGNSLQAWLSALGLALALNLIVAVGKSVAIRKLPDWARRTRTSLDDAVVELVRATRQWLVLPVTLYLGSRTLQLPERADDLIRILATVGAFVQLGLWLTAVLKLFIGNSRLRASADSPGAVTTLGALSFIGQLLIWSMALLLALANLGIDVTALIAGLGVGGIAVALAVQNILGDLFASLSIVVDKPFVVGDFIIVDDCMGTVEHVGLKTTRVRSLSGEQLVFANSDLLKSRIRNYKRMQERRVVFGFGVLYGTATRILAGIPDTVRRIVEGQPLARFDRAHFKGFGDSSLDFEVVYWMRDPDYNKYMDTQQIINLALMEAFEEAGVGFAFPTRTVQIDGSVALRRETPSWPMPEAATEASK